MYCGERLKGVQEHTDETIRYRYNKPPVGGSPAAGQDVKHKRGKIIGYLLEETDVLKLQKLQFFS